MKTNPISLCMIVKNEEANLPGCLGSVAGLVDEIVVVDTGSTDGTRSVATGFGARVVDFPWVDSFAAARNESIRHATGKWIFWLDADDRLEEESRPKLEALFTGLGDDGLAYAMWTRMLWSSGATTVADHVRLFRNRPDIRWKYRVHEQLLFGTNWLRIKARQTDIVIRHLGYRDADRMRSKEERNIPLLEMERRDNPDDPVVLFNLGWTHLRLGRPAEALPHLQRSLKWVPPNLSIVRQLYSLLVRAHEELGQRQESLAMLDEGRRRFPDDPELLFHDQRLRGWGSPLVVRGW
jgi:glycosyltransferase involved in cell wall biosynthesis